MDKCFAAVPTRFRYYHSNDAPLGAKQPLAPVVVCEQRAAGQAGGRALAGEVVVGSGAGEVGGDEDEGQAASASPGQKRRHPLCLIHRVTRPSAAAEKLGAAGARVIDDKMCKGRKVH